VSASPAASWLGVETDHAGRIVVGPDLSVRGYPEIFVVGDTAHVERAGKPLPGVAQVAIQSGQHAAHVIGARVLNQSPPAPFAYVDKGSMATIAQGYAILEKGRLKLSGPIGKLGWAFIHILYLGSAESQLLLCLQWLFSVLRGKTVSRYIDVPPSAPAERPLAPPVRQPAQS